jgi:serine/threonine-protein kinase
MTDKRSDGQSGTERDDRASLVLWPAKTTPSTPMIGVRVRSVPYQETIGDLRLVNDGAEVHEGPVSTPEPLLRPKVRDFRPGLDFVLGETLRRDPLGVTYRARDVGGGRDVAVTLCHAAATPDAAAIDRFQDALLLASVDHPAILPAQRIGRWRSQVAVERRLVYAPTLGEALPRGMRCDLARALEILRPIASALDTAHGAGIVHGDIRPEAILLSKTPGPLLVGCGVAEGLNLSTVLVATLERRTEWAWGWLEAAAPYLAPERWNGGASDSRSDQYALAVIAFRILTGELPFAAEHVARLAEMHRIAVIPRASGFRTELPPSVDVAITRALAKVAAERFTTLTAFVDTLAGHPSRVRVFTDPGRMRIFADSVDPEPTPIEEPRPGPRALFATAIACIVVLGIIITLVLR